MSISLISVRSHSARGIPNPIFGRSIKFAGTNERATSLRMCLVSKPLILYLRGRETPHSTTFTSNIGDLSSKLFAMVAISTFTSKSPGK